MGKVRGHNSGKRREGAGAAARLRPVTRAAAGALALALGVWLLPGGSEASLPPEPANPAGVVGKNAQTAGVVRTGMLPRVLTADHRAVVNFPRAAVFSPRTPVNVPRSAVNLPRTAVAAHGFPLLDLGLHPPRAARPPAGYLMAPLEVLLPTSPFGLRDSPISGLPGDFHLGQDYAAACGTPVYAADSGMVRAAGWHLWGGGNRVEVDHGNGLVTTYNHLESSAVRAGDTVRAGQAIARVGSTGWSTGCHLHFEAILNGRHTSPLTWTLLPLSALADLPAPRPDAPAWAPAPGTGSSPPGEPWDRPSLTGSTTAAPTQTLTPAPSAVPPPPATSTPVSPRPSAKPAPAPPAPAPPAPAEPPAPETAEPVPAPTEPAPKDPALTGPALTGPAPTAPVPDEPAPAVPPAGPAAPAEGVPPSSTPEVSAPEESATEGSAPGQATADHPALPASSAPDRGAAKCGQGIPGRDQYVELSVTNHQYGQLRKDADCGIFVLDPPDPE